MRLIGVGVGPGDPELVTLKAIRALRAAGRVFVPVLERDEPGRAETTVRAHAGHERIERLVFTLDDRRGEFWRRAGERVAGYLRTGDTAAFATIGDPNIYSTFTYLAGAVRELLPGVEVRTVPGVTAMQALSSASGLPLVMGEEPLVLLPLPRGVDGLTRALELDGTVVVYKGGRHLGDIAGLLRGQEAVVGTHLGLDCERIERLSTVEQAPYLSAVLIRRRP